MPVVLRLNVSVLAVIRSFVTTVNSTGIPTRHVTRHGQREPSTTGRDLSLTATILSLRVSNGDMIRTRLIKIVLLICLIWTEVWNY